LVLHGEASLVQAHGRLNDVFAVAKRDLAPGEPFTHGIGGAEAYGLIAEAATADADGRVPIAVLEAEGEKRVHAARHVPRDAPLTWRDVTLAETDLVSLLRRQRRTTGQGPFLPAAPATLT
jgi:predicted homoserine dehydrogenase-like protein